MSIATAKKEIEFFPAKLKALRLLYEKDVAEVERKYRTFLQNLDDQIAKVKNTDYAAPYIHTFSDSLRSLEKLYQEMQKVHAETRGLDFYIDQYLSRCTPRTIGRGQVNAHFERLVEEGTNAICAVSKSQSVEEDVQPLKVFCQCLVDLRYIQKNAARLIAESGVAENERNAVLEPLYQKRSQLVQEREEALRLEKLPCCGKATALRDAILESYDRQNKIVLGSGQLGTDTDYHFLVGFYKTKIEKAELNFAVSVLKVPVEAVEREPIYFHYTSEHDSILIKAPSAFLESGQYNEFMRNLYFTFVSHLPARDLLFCGVECNTMDAVVGGLGEKIREMSPGCLCHDVVERGNDLAVSGGVLAAVRTHASENSKKQKGESINDIFEYNKVFPDNPQKFLMFCISNYPEGFNAATASTMQDARRLMNGGSKGIITVICETTDGSYTDAAPMLTAEDLHADCIEFAEDGTMTYNGYPATDKIAESGFQGRDYWFVLREYFKNSASIKLDALLETANHMPNKPKPIAIPVGNANGNVFHLELTECTNQLFGLVIGTAGSGKSAFLHTLLLSAAHSHGPDELQFYIADFKSSRGSPEFSHYRKIPGVKNLYIPHIRYLLLNGKTENALDLLNIIENMCMERSVILERTGYSQTDLYNASPEVKSGKWQKLPTVFFLIDEYNTMLSGGSGDQGGENYEICNAIVTKLTSLISRLRAYGIGIILCGQSVDRRLRGQGMNNIGCRIALPVKSDAELVSLFGIDSYEARKNMQKLAGKGDALVALGDNTTNVQYVRTAYSGLTNGAQQLRLAEEIRRMYGGADYTQVEAGSEETVSVSEAAGNEVGYRAEDNELLLDMGLATANAYRMPLVYSTKESASNYYAFAAREKLCRIEQNAMFAFLHAMAGKKPVDGFKHVTYLGAQKKYEECLGEYFATVPGLRQQIDVIDNKTEIVKKLMTLRELQRSRSKNENAYHQPLFVVVRDLTWLKDEDTDWLPTLDKPKSAANVLGGVKLTESQLQEIQQRKEKAGLKVSADVMGMLASFQGSNAAATAQPQNTGRMSIADVKNALASLYALGNRYGIFLLVSSEIYKNIGEILMTKAEDKNISLSRYGIFSSFEESKLKEIDRMASENCAFIAYFNSKIRLYDYHPAVCRDWWNALRKHWNE